jgi:hypothetical protein
VVNDLQVLKKVIQAAWTGEWAGLGYGPLGRSWGKGVLGPERRSEDAS